MSSAARIAISGIFLLLSFVPDAFACKLGLGEPVAIAGIEIAGGMGAAELRLADGRKILLSGIEVPRPVSAGGKGAKHADDARRYLSELVARGPVALNAGKLNRDRHGRIIAFLMLADGGTAQERLVEAGFARVRSAPDRRVCVRHLLELEARARALSRGIWADPLYEVRDAESVEALSRLEGSFQIVEGRVARVSVIARRVYLNFGEDWRRDFTVTVEPADVKLFAAGVDSVGDLSALEGRRIRVRGFIERFNGPAMTITHPEQIEILDAGRGARDASKTDGKTRGN